MASPPGMLLMDTNRSILFPGSHSTGDKLSKASDGDAKHCDLIFPLATLALICSLCIFRVTLIMPSRPCLYLISFSYEHGPKSVTTCLILAYLLAYMLVHLPLLLLSCLRTLIRCARGFPRSRGVHICFQSRKIHSRSIVTCFFIALCMLPLTGAADDSSSSSAPPMFKMTKLHYQVWYTYWCGWLAMKYPELIDLVNGDEEEPDEPAANAPQNERDAYTEYWKKNKRVYGALIQSVPVALRTSLSANARYNGVRALEIIAQRFGVVDAHDRAAALKRVQKSYISPGAGVSLKDVTRQLDRMTEAHSEYTEAGGNELDDELLRTSFFSALPSSYQQIKTAIRTMTFTDFDEMTAAFLTQVKQYEDDMDEQRNSSAFSAPQSSQYVSQQSSQHAASTGFSPAPAQHFFLGKGGRGRGRNGRGRGAVNSFATCLRCGVLGHTRNFCQQAVARCVYCFADHFSALCPRGPGGAQRDALTPNTRVLLEQDVARGQQGHVATAQQPHFAQQLEHLQAQMHALLGAAAPPPSSLSSAPAPSPPPAAGNPLDGVDDVALHNAFMARYPQYGQHATTRQHGFFAVQSFACPFPRYVCELFVLLLSLLCALPSVFTVSLPPREGRGLDVVHPVSLPLSTPRRIREPCPRCGSRDFYCNCGYVTCPGCGEFWRHCICPEQCTPPPSPTYISCMACSDDVGVAMTPFAGLGI